MITMLKEKSKSTQTILSKRLSYRPMTYMCIGHWQKIRKRQLIAICTKLKRGSNSHQRVINVSWWGKKPMKNELFNSFKWCFTKSAPAGSFDSCQNHHWSSSYNWGTRESHTEVIAKFKTPHFNVIKYVTSFHQTISLSRYQVFL